MANKPQSSFLTEPSDEVVAEYGYTWDSSNYGGDSIEASFPPYQWPINRTPPRTPPLSM